jgi:hypothetical protein
MVRINQGVATTATMTGSSQPTALCSALRTNGTLLSSTESSTAATTGTSTLRSNRVSWGPQPPHPGILANLCAELAYG